jgi:hypothetical protein
VHNNFFSSPVLKNNLLEITFQIEFVFSMNLSLSKGSNMNLGLKAANRENNNT